MTGFLVIVLAIAFATLERSEMWSDKSKLVATFRMPPFHIHKVKHGTTVLHPPMFQCRLAVPFAAVVHQQSCFVKHNQCRDVQLCR